MLVYGFWVFGGVVLRQKFCSYLSRGTYTADSSPLAPYLKYDPPLGHWGTQRSEGGVAAL